MRSPRFLGAILGVACALLATSCSTLLSEFVEGDFENCADKAKVCAAPTVRTLAQDLDELERHIERYGSVVAKVPDVWGQARMTKHREEFEKQIATRVGTFTNTLQGSLSRSDQAYFANAFALSAAISGPQAGLLPPAPVETQSTVAVQKSAAASPPSTSAAPAAPPAIPVPPATLPTISDFDTVIKRTNVSMPTPLSFAVAQAGIALEPTLQTDQEARFLNHLQHIRRINEGDDTADSPGYSLNLVRIPVSLLPGKHTETGYGAEITFTATPYLSDELLPMTFRNLVMNDLLDQLAVPLTEVLNDNELIKDYLENAELEKFIEKECCNETPQMTACCDQTAPGQVDARQAPGKQSHQKPVMPRSKTTGRILDPHKDIGRRISMPYLSATKTRRARLPFPPSQLFEVYGIEPLYHLAQDAHDAFKRDVANRQFVHYPDVQSYLQDELAAAYKFLANPHNWSLWHFCDHELAVAVQSQRDQVLKEKRCQFLKDVDDLTDPKRIAEKGLDKFHPQSTRHSATAALAWAIVVESALLNEQLIQDMKETAAAKACGCHQENWQAYFEPNPSAEARHAFNEYVRCRWPIHVFALDPMTQDQNIADAFSLRRELQLAMSLAFVSGQVNASNMTKFARRIEQDYETIALNRTMVGFSHGEDTFGWRFYPRFQTPDIESNAVVLFRDLLIGGPRRNVALRQRQLEPGPRDCAAIVIMPSFVPYVTFDSSANWFKLINPKRKELTAAQAMRLSRAVKSIQQCGPNVADADCYRAGDLPLLLRKAEQLSQRLPFQSQLVQVPYENTLGGFAMFNTGVTDLAPQLNGWYGAEGIDVNNGNTIFLVGDHFSVLGTRVIVGGKPIDNQNGQELLSRQVIKVTVPAGAQVLHDQNGDFVNVQIATPYGVTHHLLIPALGRQSVTTKSGAEGFSLDNTSLDITYAWEEVMAEKRYKLVQKSAVPPLRLRWHDASGKSLPFVEVTFRFSGDLHPKQTLKVSDPKNGSYVVDMNSLVKEVLDYLNGQMSYDPNHPPDSLMLQTQEISVTPLETGDGVPPKGHAVQNVVSANQLTIHFKPLPDKP